MPFPFISLCNVNRITYATIIVKRCHSLYSLSDHSLCCRFIVADWAASPPAVMQPTSDVNLPTDAGDQPNGITYLQAKPMFKKLQDVSSDVIIIILNPPVLKLSICFNKSTIKPKTRPGRCPHGPLPYLLDGAKRRNRVRSLAHSLCCRFNVTDFGCLAPVPMLLGYQASPSACQNNWRIRVSISGPPAC